MNVNERLIEGTRSFALVRARSFGSGPLVTRISEEAPKNA